MGPYRHTAASKDSRNEIPRVKKKHETPKLPADRNRTLTKNKKIEYFTGRLKDNAAYTPIVEIPKTAAQASKNWSSLKGQIKDPPKPNSNRHDANGRAKGRVLPVAVLPKSPVIVIGPSSGLPEKWKKIKFPNYDSEGNLLGLPIPRTYERLKCLALDCEMVGVGPMKESALARVSIVNEHGVLVLDRYVKPKVAITDYRTFVSGIREHHMEKAHGFEDVVAEVAKIIKNRLLIGHDIQHDFKALMLEHSNALTRDTSWFFRSLLNRTPSLKFLAEKFFDLKIQTGEHSSIQDAQVTMALYLTHRREWEEKLRDFRKEAKKRRR